VKELLLYWPEQEFSVNKTKKRILCVDDQQDICELVTQILKEYEVISASSKAEALRQATTEKYDLIILDYYLPDGTGLEICLLIRGFDKDTPILFATTSSAINEINAGAQGLIDKGLEFQDALEAFIPQLLANPKNGLHLTLKT
jgi:CheY-like chemotaxis protein